MVSVCLKVGKQSTERVLISRNFVDYLLAVVRTDANDGGYRTIRIRA